MLPSLQILSSDSAVAYINNKVYYFFKEECVAFRNNNNHTGYQYASIDTEVQTHKKRLGLVGCTVIPRKDFEELLMQQ